MKIITEVWSHIKHWTVLGSSGALCLYIVLEGAGKAGWVVCCVRNYCNPVGCFGYSGWFTESAGLSDLVTPYDETCCTGCPGTSDKYEGCCSTDQVQWKPLPAKNPEFLNDESWSIMASLDGRTFFSKNLGDILNWPTPWFCCSARNCLVY